MNAKAISLSIVLLGALAIDQTRAATIQFLTPAGSPLGVAYGVDGLNVVGQDVLQRGFLYNGATKTYTVIQPPGGGQPAPRESLEVASSDTMLRVAITGIYSTA